MEKIVIVGGGIAGLSCLNALLDKNVSPLLLEAGVIGSPKMCGEFIAPIAVSLLEKWEIGPIEKIQEAQFHSPYSNLNIKFTRSAGAMTRRDAELMLSKRARKYLGRIREHTAIKKITPSSDKSPFLLVLESGEQIEAESVIFATGKFLTETNHMLKHPYYGIKLHINSVLTPSTLHMYSVKNAYFGIVPVSNSQTNFTCLAKQDEISKFGGRNYLKKLISTNKILKSFFDDIDLDKVDWLACPSPEFKMKSVPNWQNACWIGDALASLHPAVGCGFAHSISSGVVAADFYLKNNLNGFRQSAITSVRTKIFLGKLMHHTLLNPVYTTFAFPFMKITPGFLKHCLRKLDYLGNF